MGTSTGQTCVSPSPSPSSSLPASSAPSSSTLSPTKNLDTTPMLSCQKHRPPNLRRGCTTQRSCTRSAGRVPFAKELFAITRDAFVDKGASINTAPIGQTTRGTLPAGRQRNSAGRVSANGRIVHAGFAGLSFKVDTCHACGLVLVSTCLRRRPRITPVKSSFSDDSSTTESIVLDELDEVLGICRNNYLLIKYYNTIIIDKRI